MHGLTFIDFLIWTSLCTWMMSSIPLHACICYLFNLTIYSIARNTKIWPNTPLRYGPTHRQWFRWWLAKPSPLVMPNRTRIEPRPSDRGSAREGSGGRMWNASEPKWNENSGPLSLADPYISDRWSRWSLPGRHLSLLFWWRWNSGWIFWGVPGKTHLCGGQNRGWP